eukprot:TRINITY_DN2573_c0_g1_i1.p1 TRINITY_DN2573_c0_g1~~TRINITY_DN2573_c0_g1_i1.p1  ORF type:complete len:246 (+),score=68.00 TRINITY_DN2573_c0_g1_i1:52-789(+)
MAASEGAFVTCTHDEAVKFFKVRQTCVEMLEDRGYVVTESQKVEGMDEFKSKFCTVQGGQLRIHRENLSLYAEKEEEMEEIDESLTEAERAEDEEERIRNRSIMVFFVTDTKLKNHHINAYYNLLEKKERGCSRAVIVSPTLPTNICKTAFAACDSAGKQFEHFLESELLINVRRHELVPKHEPLSSKSKRALLQSMKIKEGQLPRIQLADPLARHFGLRKGNVVKITRPSETAGEYVTYRLVQA